MQIGRPKTDFRTPHTDLSGIALCVIGRRENRYACEFVEHYKAIGFDHIIIIDNNHDGEERFEDVLHDYIADGFVEIINYRNKQGYQSPAYSAVYRKYSRRYRWIAFFDFDEYLTLVYDTDIHALMRRYEDYDCVFFNWMNYGDNGLLRDDGRKLQERFTEPLPFDSHVQYQDRIDNDHVKCVLRGGLDNVCFFSTPHVPDSPKMRCCDSLAEPCHQTPFHSYCFDVAYLKHYLTKTVEEWCLNKWQKGTGNKENIEAFRSHYVGRFFGYNEWTQEKDAIMRELTGLMPHRDTGHRRVVIVNFNTQRLTDCTIRSLNKHTPGCSITVFDNSDREPYVNTFDNVEVMDNTKGQIIDFEAMLAAYPNKYPTPENKYGSAKHCKTIDYCFDLFPDGFLLMDSDILIQKDVTPFFDDGCAWTGSIEMHKDRWNVGLPRVLPFLTYINVPLCRKHGIRYFNPDKMFALVPDKPDIAYDTGCWFYEACAAAHLPENHIRITDYMLHLRHGSWMAREEENEWLDAHHELWD